MKNISVLDIQPDDQFFNHNSWILWTATTAAISMPDNIDMVSCQVIHTYDYKDINGKEIPPITNTLKFHKNRRLTVVRS